jgi:hypothetical protein
MSRASACPQYRLTADILAEAQEQRRKCSMMVIYRSTTAQANQYVEVLERMNMVGMAVQILDAIPEAESELKNKTRAEMVSLVL